MRKRRLVSMVVAGLLAIGCSKDDKKAEPVVAQKASEKADSKSASKSEKGDESGLGAKNGGVPTSREGQMYLLGQKLSQAAMVHGRAAPDVVDRTFKAAGTVADITLQAKLAPLPALTGDKAKDGAEGMAYLLRGQGKELGQMISTKFGDTSAATYELAVKINMLPMLYIDDPKDKMADTMVEVFTRLSAKAKLPDTALGPIIAKMKARAPMNEVTDMALDLNKSLPIVIAEVYEKK